MDKRQNLDKFVKLLLLELGYIIFIDFFFFYMGFFNSIYGQGEYSA
jgi:hypothetical protein